MTSLKITLLALSLAALLSGCASGPNTSSGSNPTLSGYVDTGGQKTFGK
jgi:starvation-inducible outer membrane lipoprotein